MRKRSAGESQPSLLRPELCDDATSLATPPLADRMRPTELPHVLGQEHLLGPGKPLYLAITEDRIASTILWGPPGSGKTTLARLLSHTARAEFVPFSAVLGGVGELRTLIQKAAERRARERRGTILFVDEIHRFNRAQQDAFLPHVESGAITLLGATTENPSFSVNASLLSRCQVFHLKAIGDQEIEAILHRALEDSDHGLGALGLEVQPEALRAIAQAARGDARRALGLLERTVAHLEPRATQLDLAAVGRAADENTVLFDKLGDQHYDVVSALIKSLRGSDPDAAIYWTMRLLEAGDDPLFVLRRLIIFASEDIGNADPRALGIAVDADQAFRRLGMPEGIYPIAQACLYLACAPKSDAAKNAWQAAQARVTEHGALAVPNKLKNAPTRLLAAEGSGKGYQYPHSWPGHYVPQETYLPEQLIGERYYVPSDQGVERQIQERLARLRALSRTKKSD